MTNKQISNILDKIGKLLILKGENTFKVRAYETASRKIEGLSEPAETLVKEDRLRDVSGLGSSMVKHVTEMVENDHSPYHEELKATIPVGLQEMLSISGIGAKKVRLIAEQLQIETIGELEYACRENRLVKLDGFGLKTQERVLKGIELLKRSRGLYLLNLATAEADKLVEAFQRHPDVWRVAVAGDVRRGMEVVRDIDFIVSHPDVDRITPVLERYGQVDHTEQGELIVIGDAGIPVRIHCVSEETFAITLYHWTGSEAHREKIARHADSMGITVTDRHVIRDRMVLPCPDEPELYRILGLQYIPPELREGGDEVDRAASQTLPVLPSREDLRGIIHNHTTYSDGTHTVQEMADAARERGYQYIALCDHSKSAAYAHGLSIDRVRAQQEEIDALNDQYEYFRILKGIESDILPDGSLDYPDDILASFDLVVASVHSGFNMSEADMTARIIRAVQNPFTTILGHPTGRLLLARDGYPVDMHRIIEEAAAHGVAIEVNANPHRLDMDWRHIPYALACGVQLSIGPDAHQMADLDYVDFGLTMVKKGGVAPSQLINTLTAEELIGWKDRRVDNGKLIMEN